VRADLRVGKKSLPVVAALRADNDTAARLARLYLRPEPLDETELTTAASLIEQAGGRTWAQQEAERYRQLALACLPQARSAPEPAAHLATLASLITHRDH
jgi:geranylgeranyl diphosphate synthase, type I